MTKDVTTGKMFPPPADLEDTDTDIAKGETYVSQAAAYGIAALMPLCGFILFGVGAASAYEGRATAGERMWMVFSFIATACLVGSVVLIILAIDARHKDARA